MSTNRIRIIGAASGVGSPEPEGLSVREVRQGLRRLAGTRGLRLLEIAEYSPDRDRHGVARLISELIGEVLPQLTRPPRPSAPVRH